MATQVTRKIPIYVNRKFDHGVFSTISWFYHGDTPNVPPTAAMIVEFIKDNMIELAQEEIVDDERVADNAGFLVGWILEEGIVEIIQNLIDIALEGNLFEELLRQDVGIVVGFVIGHPEVFRILAGGN